MIEIDTTIPQKISDFGVTTMFLIDKIFAAVVSICCAANHKFCTGNSFISCPLHLILNTMNQPKKYPYTIQDLNEVDFNGAAIQSMMLLGSVDQLG